MRFHPRIILLALGVVLGYGSAIAHYARWRGHADVCGGDHYGAQWHDCACQHAPATEHGRQTKPVQ